MPLKVGLREGLGDICEGLQFPLSLHSASSPFNTHAKTQRQTSPYTYPKGRAETGLLGNTLFRNLIPGSGSEGRAGESHEQVPYSVDQRMGDQLSQLTRLSEEACEFVHRTPCPGKGAGRIHVHHLHLL